MCLSPIKGYNYYLPLYQFKNTISTSFGRTCLFIMKNVVLMTYIIIELDCTCVK